MRDILLRTQWDVFNMFTSHRAAPFVMWGVFNTLISHRAVLCDEEEKAGKMRKEVYLKREKKER